MSLFVNPVEMGANALWLVLPLAGVGAVVYKTVRVERLRELPLQILRLLIDILVGLAVLGAAFYLLLEYVA